MFSLFNFSSIFPGGGGQLTPFAPMCGRPWADNLAITICRHSKRNYQCYCTDWWSGSDTLTAPVLLVILLSGILLAVFLAVIVTFACLIRYISLTAFWRSFNDKSSKESAICYVCYCKCIIIIIIIFV